MFLHFGIGYSAFGTLRHILEEYKESAQVRLFADDLSIGSLYEFDKNMDKRIEWMNNLWETVSNEDELEFEQIKKEYEITYDMKDVNRDKKIVVWYGENVVEEAALRYLVYRFFEYDIFEVPVSKNICKKIDEETYSPRAVAECSPDELFGAMKNMREMSNEKKLQLKQEWQKLTQEVKYLRVLKDNKIINVEEDYFDGVIYESATQDCTSALRIVGRVLGSIDDTVGDTYINYRVVELIKAGKLDYKGDLRKFNKLLIKQKY